MHTMKKALHTKENLNFVNNNNARPRNIRNFQDPQGLIYPNSANKATIPIPIHMFNNYVPMPPSNLF